MKTNEVIKVTIIAAILIVALSIAYYFVIFLPSSSGSNNTISNTLKCNELYELKKSKYWENKIGQSKAIYNADLGACLALNIYNDFDTKEYFAMVMNMTDDSTLMHYNSTPKGFYFEGDQKITCNEDYIYFEFIQNGKEIKEYGCDIDNKGELTDNFLLFDKMFEKVRSYGFEVFDGFSSE